jgi:hypothetical protein
MKKTQRFTIAANLKIQATIDISANSMEDALKRARELDVTDFVDFKGEYCDGELESIGWISEVV